MTDKANCQITTRNNTTLETIGDTAWVLVERTRQTAPDGSVNITERRSRIMNKQDVRDLIQAQRDRVQLLQAEIDSAKVRARNAKTELDSLIAQVNATRPNGRNNRDTTPTPPSPALTSLNEDGTVTINGKRVKYNARRKKWLTL